MSPLAGILTTWATVGRPPRGDWEYMEQRMSEYTRGLITGALGTYIIWQLDEYTNLPLWANLLIPIAIGFLVAFTITLLANLTRRSDHPDRA